MQCKLPLVGASKSLSFPFLPLPKYSPQILLCICRPKLLQLSVEIIDNVGEPTGSLEINIQSKRIANMMETK